jgi:response regulator RpfG family c-di-GMP phosphodiesterase
MTKNESDPQYIPVRIHTLRAESIPGFEIYVKVGDRHVHYFKGEDAIDPARIKKLQDGKIKKLFIPMPQEERYLAYLDAGLAALAQTNQTQEQKAAVAHDALVTAAENAERSVDSETAFRRTEGQFQKVVDFLMNDRRAVQSILKQSGASLDNFQHAANVTTLALSLCSRLEIKDPQDLLQMGFAGLLHDLGKSRLSIDPLKGKSEMTAEERKAYERHPDESVAMLSGKPFITPRVLGLIQDHEEVGRSRGFPNKKDILKLAQLYQVFNLANAFDRFCMEKQKPPMEAIDAFFEAQGELFDPEMITVLATALT